VAGDDEKPAGNIDINAIEMRVGKKPREGNAVQVKYRPERTAEAIIQYAIQSFALLVEGEGSKVRTHGNFFENREFCQMIYLRCTQAIKIVARSCSHGQGCTDNSWDA
jgi:hypothetical protein